MPTIGNVVMTISTPVKIAIGIFLDIRNTNNVTFLSFESNFNYNGQTFGLIRIFFSDTIHSCHRFDSEPSILTTCGTVRSTTHRSYLFRIFK